MGMKRLPTLILFLMIVLALVACTRSASEAPTGEGTPGAGEELPFPTPASEGTPDVMGTLLAGGFATQTAVAKGMESQVTEEPGGATPTPEEVTVQEPSPTPKPTEKPAAETAAGACESPYKVQAGEWIYSIGRKCGIDPQAIINTNNLSYPFIIYPGDELVLPTGSEMPSTTTGGNCPSPYKVQVGEWVYSIARKCGTTPEAIISANNLAYPYTIFPGQDLVIP